MKVGRILPLFVWITGVLSLEWSTSGGQHCTKRCQATEKDGEEVYWCPSVDGINTKSSKKERPGDYCTPSDEPELIPAPEPEPESKPVTLPAPIGQRSTTPKTGPGGSGFNPGSSNSMSSLKGFPCTGPCSPSQDGGLPGTPQGLYECPITGHSKKNKFYCSLETAELQREQVSSKKKLWCIASCVQGNQAEGETFKCNTMAGPDLCSPSDKKSYKGTDCTSRCELHMGEGYMCHVDKEKKKLESCGFWGPKDKSLGSNRGQDRKMDFTTTGQICAGPCTQGSCTSVEWVPEGSKSGYNLIEKIESCRKGGLGETGGASVKIAMGSFFLSFVALLQLAI